MTIKLIIDNENAMFGVVSNLVSEMNNISTKTFAIDVLEVDPRVVGETLSLTHDLHDCLAANWGAVNTLGAAVGKFFVAFDMGHELTHKEVDVAWQNLKCVLDAADQQQYVIGLNLGEISEALEMIRLHLNRTAARLVTPTDSVGDGVEDKGLLDSIISGQGGVSVKLSEIGCQLTELRRLLFGADVEKLPEAEAKAVGTGLALDKDALNALRGIPQPK